jgi:hypothetical protein
MIRGGLEYGLGIYVTGVDKDSVADRAGLLVRITPLYDARDREGTSWTRIDLVEPRFTWMAAR